MLEPGWIRLLSKELRRWLSMIEVLIGVWFMSAHAISASPTKVLLKP